MSRNGHGKQLRRRTVRQVNTATPQSRPPRYTLFHASQEGRQIQVTSDRVFYLHSLVDRSTFSIRLPPLSTSPSPHFGVVPAITVGPSVIVYMPPLPPKQSFKNQPYWALPGTITLHRKPYAVKHRGLACFLHIYDPHSLHITFPYIASRIPYRGTTSSLEITLYMISTLPRNFPLLPLFHNVDLPTWGDVRRVSSHFVADETNIHPTSDTIPLSHAPQYTYVI